MLGHPVALAALMAVLVGMFAALPNDKFRFSTVKRSLNGHHLDTRHPHQFMLSVVTNRVTGEVAVVCLGDPPAPASDWEVTGSVSVQGWRRDEGWWGVTQRINDVRYEQVPATDPELRGRVVAVLHQEQDQLSQLNGWDEDMWRSLETGTPVVRRLWGGDVFNVATVMALVLTGVSAWLVVVRAAGASGVKRKALI